jgi:hypothetical protein
LPESWIGLTAVDLLIVPHETWASAGMKIDAVVDWIAMGGVCLIVDAPEEAQWAIARTLEEKGPFVRVEDKGPGNTQAVLSVNMGAGQIRFIERATLLQSAYFTGRPSAARNLPGTGSPRRPTLDQLKGPPFFPVLFFLLVFSVLVGPVGWWYAVGKKGQPLIYFGLAPLLSLGVVLIVMAVDFLNQGVRPRAACITAELIDQTTQRRITLSQFALYFPFVIGQSLEGDFNELPHFLSVQSDSRIGYSLQGLKAAPARQGMVYGGSALPARRTSWYAREKIHPERRRLIAWKENGRIHVENHLGTPLERLVVCCEGSYAVLDRVDEGERREAEEVDGKTAREAFENIRPGKEQRAVFYPLQSGLSDRWLEAFEEGKNSYAALRGGGFGELLWVDNAEVENGMGLLLGIY